jgi:hypothetical protein
MKNTFSKPIKKFLARIEKRFLASSKVRVPAPMCACVGVYGYVPALVCVYVRSLYIPRFLVSIFYFFDHFFLWANFFQFLIFLTRRNKIQISNLIQIKKIRIQWNFYEIRIA